MTQQKSSKKGDSIKNMKPKAVESSISSVQVAQESNRKSQKSKKSKKLDASKKHVNHPLPRQMLRVQRSESVGGVVRMEMRYVSYERKEDCDVGEDGSVAMESKAVVAILKKLLTELGALSVDEESSDDKSDSTPNSSSNRPVKHHQKKKREKRSSSQIRRKLDSLHNQLHKGSSHIGGCTGNLCGFHKD